jgi:uncharacterized membrane protein
VTRPARPLAIAGVAVLSAGGVALLGPGPPRGALGIALVLLVTGAALSELLGPSLSGADRALAVLASSIAVAILTGVALGATHVGFAAGTWALALGAIAVAASIGAWLTGGAAPSEEAPRYGCLARRLKRSAPSLACFAVALAIAALAVALAHHSAAHNAERAEQIPNLVKDGGR